MKLVVDGPSTPDTTRQPVPSLVQAVVRGHDWFEQIVQGEVTGGRAIGKLENLDERYVSRILPCAFLAPDIVEAILDGRQPEDLTLDRLVARIPLDWKERRKQLGSAASKLKITKLHGRETGLLGRHRRKCDCKIAKPDSPRDPGDGHRTLGPFLKKRNAIARSAKMGTIPDRFRKID